MKAASAVLPEMQFLAHCFLEPGNRLITHCSQGSVGMTVLALFGLQERQLHIRTRRQRWKNGQFAAM